MMTRRQQRKRVAVSLSIHPVVLRALRKNVRRSHGDENARCIGWMVERLIVCWLMSDPRTRLDIIRAGCFNPRFWNSRARKAELVKLAESIRDQEGVDR